MGRSNEANLARLYHLHSSHVRARVLETELDTDHVPCCFRTYPGAKRVWLPGRDFELPASVGDVLAKRRSLRDFVLRPLPLATLGRLLHVSYGVCGVRAFGDERLYERPSPSAGAKYPLEVYVAAQSVEGLADGIYHYDALAHELELRREGLAQPALVALALGQNMIRAANLVFILTAIPQRTMVKYGQRGYRYLWLDAGHLGQNLYLAATAIGLGPVAVGGFLDAELGTFLALPSGEEPLYLVCVGQPAPCKDP